MDHNILYISISAAIHSVTFSVLLSPGPVREWLRSSLIGLAHILHLSGERVEVFGSLRLSPRAHCKFNCNPILIPAKTHRVRKGGNGEWGCGVTTEIEVELSHNHWLYCCCCCSFYHFSLVGLKELSLIKCSWWMLPQQQQLDGTFDCIHHHRYSLLNCIITGHDHWNHIKWHSAVAEPSENCSLCASTDPITTHQKVLHSMRWSQQSSSSGCYDATCIESNCNKSFLRLLFDSPHHGLRGRYIKWDLRLI